MSHVNTSNPTNNISRTTDCSTLEDEQSCQDFSHSHHQKSHAVPSNTTSSIPVSSSHQEHSHSTSHSHSHPQDHSHGQPLQANQQSNSTFTSGNTNTGGIAGGEKTFQGTNQQEAGGLTKSGDRGSDKFEDQPGSARASDHRDIHDPRSVDTEIGAKGDSTFATHNELAGGQGVSVGGGEGTGTNETIPGGVKGTGGMGKRDGEDAMGGGGGMVGKIAEKLHMGHGNSKTQ